MKLNTPAWNNLLLLLIATVLSIQTTTINAFSITLSCNDPCTDLKEDGIPADGVINAEWDSSGLPPDDDTLSFALQWASPTKVLSGADLFTIETTNYVKNKEDNPGEGSATLKLPQLYIPPGDYYYITVSTKKNLRLSELGPYTMNESFSSYSVPRQDQKYNFTVTLCPTDNKSCDGNNFTHNPDDYLLVKWSLVPNATVQNARFTLWWGNPANYGNIPYVTDIINNTLWDGRMDEDIPPQGVELEPRDSQILFSNNPPPGDSYYVGVYLRIPGGKNEKTQHHMAFSKPFTMIESRSRPIETDEDGSNSVSPMYTGMLLSILLITLYLFI